MGNYLAYINKKKSSRHLYANWILSATYEMSFKSFVTFS